LDDADLPSDRYQLFKRCGKILSPMSSVFARGVMLMSASIGDSLIGADIAQR